MTSEVAGIVFDPDIGFQQRAAASIVSHVSEIIKLGERDTVVLFAPTGAGKTVVMGFAMRNLVLGRPDLRLAFVWLAPFSLHDQGKLRLAGVEQLASKNHAEIGVRLDRNDLVFLNWESVKRDINHVRKGTESKGGLASICAATRQSGIKIVLVIDESHYSRDTFKAEEVIDLIGPAAIVEVSATPRVKRQRWVPVDRLDVIKAGLIHKHVDLQIGLGEIIEEHGRIYGNDIFLQAAMKKRADLARRYAEAGIAVNPLLLIQLPNGKIGDDMLVGFKRMLASDYDMTTRKGGNGKVAVWTEKEKTIDDINTEPELTRNDGDVCVLIFKQAVAIGWDCRRAQVLLKARHPSESLSFDIQTVGRIMRMPERHHYPDEDLNLGYAYSPYPKTKNGEEFGIVTASAHLRDGVACPPLLSSRREIEVRAVNNAEVRQVVSRLIERLGIKPDLDPMANRQCLREAGFDPNARLEATINYIGGRLTGETDKMPSGGGSERLENRDANTISRLLSADLEGSLGDKASADAAKTEIVRLIGQSIGIRKPSEIQSMLLGGDNHRQFNQMLSATIEGILGGPRTTERAKEDTWSMPRVLRYNTQVDGETRYQEMPDDGLFAYEPHFVREDQSNPEDAFERMLIGPSGRSAIQWWHKNRDTAPDGFSLTYEMPDRSIHEFLPDYLVGFKDGVIGVFETKDQGAFTDEKQQIENRAKIKALNDWAQRQRHTVMVEVGFVLLGSGMLRRYASADRSSSVDFQTVLTRHLAIAKAS